MSRSVRYAMSPLLASKTPVWRSKFIVAMVYTQVLVKADINEAIVASPAICMNDAGNVGFASNDGLQSAFGRVRHDFGVDAVAAFE